VFAFNKIKLCLHNLQARKMWLEIPFGLKIQTSTIEENTKRHQKRHQKRNVEIPLKIFLRVARNCKLSFHTLVSLICSQYWAILAQKYNQKWKIRPLLSSMRVSLSKLKKLRSLLTKLKKLWNSHTRVKLSLTPQRENPRVQVMEKECKGFTHDLLHHSHKIATTSSLSLKTHSQDLTWQQWQVKVSSSPHNPNPMWSSSMEWMNN
jgi:hypothetical protein